MRSHYPRIETTRYSCRLHEYDSAPRCSCDVLFADRPSFSFLCVFSFDLTRCDEFGSPHRRVLSCDPLNSSQSASGVMDFQWFPSVGAHASTHTLVAAVRSGEINVIDMRVPAGASSTSGVGANTPPKLFRAQARSTTSTASLANRFSSPHVGANPPAAILVSGCGNNLHVFTELGTVEMWDSRNLRAAYERLVIIDQLWTESNPGATASYAAAAAAADTNHAAPALTAAAAAAHAAAAPRSLGFEFRQPSSRICSAACHPQDDLLFTFQLLNGCVGVLDLNPLSSGYRTCSSLVSFDPDYVASADAYDLALRTRRTHAFIPNGQGGTRASARREKRGIVANTRNRIEMWGS